MLNTKILATMSLGLLVAACGQPYQRQTASAPYPAPYQSTTAREMSLSERNCSDYGFTSPSSNYDRCVQREMRAREQGRVARDYDQSRLVQDASNACYDYGLERNTQRFDNCVSREVDARRYREQATTPAPVAYYAPQPAPGPTRDEFGFRYDGQGNRIDANGRIISPYTTNR